MNKNNITFILNQSDKLVIELEDPLTAVHCCYQALLTLYFCDQHYKFPYESIRYMVLCLKNMLENALAKKLYLHDTIKDLGREENQYYQDKPVLLDEKNHWVGTHNRLWSGKGLTAWLYNDSDGATILEITPVYTYPINDPLNTNDYIPYEQWIKNYKPYIIKKIPVETAKEWLQQATSILSIIEAPENKS